MSKGCKPRIAAVNDEGILVKMNSATVYRRAQDGWGLSDFCNKFGISSSERILELLRNNEIKESEITRILRNSERQDKLRAKKAVVGETIPEALEMEETSDQVEVVATTESEEVEPVSEEEGASYEEIPTAVDVEKRKAELEKKISSLKAEMAKAEDEVIEIDTHVEDLVNQIEAKRARLLEIQQETRDIKNSLELLINEKKEETSKRERFMVKIGELKVEAENANTELESYQKVCVSLEDGEFVPEKYAPEKTYVSVKGGSLLDRVELLDDFNGRELKMLATLMCGIENIILSGLRFELNSETIPEKFVKVLEEEFKDEVA